MNKFLNILPKFVEDIETMKPVELDSWILYEKLMYFRKNKYIACWVGNVELFRGSDMFINGMKVE